MIQEDNIEEYIEKEVFVKRIQNLSSTMILNVFNLPSKLAVKKESIYALENFDYKRRTNYHLMNAMMYDQLGETVEMGKRLEIIDKDKKIVFITNLIKRIVHHHLLYNKIQYVGYQQHLVDKYLKSKKDMKMIRGRTRK